MIPACSHTGTPRHFHSSTTSGSASLIRARIRPSIWPRQSPSSLIRPSISFEGDWAFSGTPSALLHHAALVVHLVAVERVLAGDEAAPVRRQHAVLDRLAHVIV